MIREVFLNNTTNTLSFKWERNVNVCIGETNGTLEDFLAFMRDNWTSRNIPLDSLPKIKHQDNS